MNFPHSVVGQRGERPVKFPGVPYHRARTFSEIPGVVADGDGLACTVDIAPTIAKLLDRPVPPSAVIVPEEQAAAELKAMPGLERYRSLGLQDRLRPYQKIGALFLARRCAAMQADEPRLGKCAQALAAATLIGASADVHLTGWRTFDLKRAQHSTLSVPGNEDDMMMKTAETLQAKV